MALGRFLSGVVATKLHSWIIIKIGTGVMGVALILLCLPINGAVQCIGTIYGNGNLPNLFNGVFCKHGNGYVKSRSRF